MPDGSSEALMPNAAAIAELADALSGLLCLRTLPWPALLPISPRPPKG